MRITLIFICIILSTYTFSQNTFSYIGTLILSNNTPMSFSLELQEDIGIVNDSGRAYQLANCRKCIDKDIIIEHQNNVISTKDALIKTKDEIIDSLRKEIIALKS